MTGLVARLALGSVFSSISKGLAAAGKWVLGSITHILIAALGISLLWGFWGHHDAAKWEKVAASTETRCHAENHIWARADQINHHSIDTLIAGINDQSVMVRRWADTAKGRQDAAQAALRRATARGATAEAHAAQIEAEASQNRPGCQTGPKVLSSKGDL